VAGRPERSRRMLIADRAVSDIELLLSAGASESSVEIDNQLRIFVSYERGFLATWETTDALICVATTPRSICS
jgi:hypothetical protein